MSVPYTQLGWINYVKERCPGKLDIVEVGVHRGVNAFYALRNIDVNKFYLVDDYTQEKPSGMEARDIVATINAAENILKEFEDKIIWIRKQSHEAVKDFAPESIDVVYIDADHTYEHVVEDIKDWWEIVKVGGVLAGHDFNNTICIHVGRAVEEFCDDNGLQFEVSENQGDWMIHKI